MPKATLTFNLDDYDDVRKFKMCTSASELFLAIWNVLHSDLREMDRNDTMPPGINYGHMVAIGFKGPKEEFIPSKLSGEEMLELVLILINGRLEEANIDLGLTE